MSGRLTQQQISAFERDGYLVAEGVVTDADLDPVINEYEEHIERKARELLAEGLISDLHSEAPFNKRIALLSAQCPRILDGLDIMQLRGRAMFGFLNCPNLLDAVQCLVGTEITCNPIQHIRPKPPSNVTQSGYYNVPWHQDAAVTWKEADDSNIVTCWTAVVDATVENGCMEVIPGVFRSGYLEHHSGEGGTTILPELLPEVAPVPVPVKKGGVVFMHRLTPHRSTPNFTDTVRWSIDLRYQPTGQPTGRPFHPEFEVRSSTHPVVADYETWVKRWVDALESSKGARWHRV